MISDKILTVINDGGFKYTTSGGHFLLYNPIGGAVLHSRSCRVEIEWRWVENPYCRHLGIAYLDIDFIKLDNFISKIESQLNLKEKTVIHKTNHDNRCVILHLSPFWIKDAISRGILTLLLRYVTCVYSGSEDLFAESDKYHLMKKPGIVETIKLFLAGYTTPSAETLTLRRRWDGDSYAGFINEFNGLNKDAILEKLSKPVGDELQYFNSVTN